MKILFVHPYPLTTKFASELYSKIFVNTSKPILFPILAALTPKEHSIEIIGTDDGSLPYDERYDIVGISCMTPEAINAYKIADEFRKNGNYVVLGGWHPSALPEEAKQHADTVVIGEAEEIWPKLLNDVQNKKTKPFYYQERPVDLKLIPPLRRDIYPKDTNLDINATRGCLNKCKFCSIVSQPLRRIYRMRPIENVISDIKLNPRRYFCFYDNSLTLNLNYSKQLFKEMEGLNKKFLAYGNINVLGSNEELLKLANEAGCTGWLIGFESISQETLRSIGKKANVVDEYIKSIKKIHDYNMIVIGSFVFGFDNDTKDIFNKTNDFISKSDIDFPYPNILTPYPGTYMYDLFDKQGRILTKDWSKYDLKHVVFQPKNMAAEELHNNVLESSKNWYNLSNIFNRFVCNTKISINQTFRTISWNIQMRRRKLV